MGAHSPFCGAGEVSHHRSHNKGEGEAHQATIRPQLLAEFGEEGDARVDEKNDGEEQYEFKVEEPVRVDLEEEDAVSRDALQSNRTRFIRAPRTPTKAEKERNEIGHWLYAPWCKVCVSSRGVCTPHYTRDRVKSPHTPSQPSSWTTASQMEEAKAKGRWTRCVKPTKARA